MLSAEQFQQVIQMIQSGLQPPAAPPTAPPGIPASMIHSPKLVGKHFRSDTFNGDAGKWEDWSFGFKRGIRSMSRAVYDKMTIWELKTEEISEGAELDLDMEQRSAELYDILCQYCSGEAMTILRTVSDMEGIKAWQRLYKKYNPRTMARGLRLMTESISPPKMKDLVGIESGMAKWEEKVKMLENQFGEIIGEKMKVAIMTNMLPSSLQDYIYTHIDIKTTYDELKEKLRAMVANKVATNMGPAPMDIGNVGRQERGEEDWRGQEEEQGYYEEEQQVDAVSGHLQCRTCQGYGHFARECPSRPAGKGDKGKGKGFVNFKGGKGGKGKGGGYGYNPGKGFQNNNFGNKGKGKGYQGMCFRCGKVGHKAAECSAMETNYVETEEETVDMGGAWVIGNVMTEKKTEKKTERKTEKEEFQDVCRCKKDRVDLSRVENSPTKSSTRSVTTVNRFISLAECDGGEEDEEFVQVEVNAVQVGSDSKEMAGSGRKQKWTRASCMTFNVANVAKPLAAAGKVVAAGNRVVLDEKESYIEHIATGEKMQLRKEKGVYVFDVKFEDDETAVITLDSGAGVNVWPKGMKNDIKLEPRQEGLRMIAANGTAIENVGTKKISFRGLEKEQAAPIFSWQSR